MPRKQELLTCQRFQFSRARLARSVLCELFPTQNCILAELTVFMSSSVLLHPSGVVLHIVPNFQPAGAYNWMVGVAKDSLCIKKTACSCGDWARKTSMTSSTDCAARFQSFLAGEPVGPCFGSRVFRDRPGTRARKGQAEKGEAEGTFFDALICFVPQTLRARFLPSPRQPLSPVRAATCTLGYILPEGGFVSLPFFSDAEREEPSPTHASASHVQRGGGQIS